MTQTDDIIAPNPIVSGVYEPQSFALSMIKQVERVYLCKGDRLRFEPTDFCGFFWREANRRTAHNSSSFSGPPVFGDTHSHQALNPFQSCAGSLATIFGSAKWTDLCILPGSTEPSAGSLTTHATCGHGSKARTSSEHPNPH